MNPGFVTKDASLSSLTASPATPQHLNMSVTNVKTSPSSSKSPVKRLLRSFASTKSSSQIQRTSSSSLTAVINSDDEGSDSHHYYSSQPFTKAVIRANSSANLEDFPAEIEVVYEEGVVLTEQDSPLSYAEADGAATAAQQTRSNISSSPNSSSTTTTATSTTTTTTAAISKKQRRPLLKMKSIHDIQEYPQARSHYNIALKQIHDQQWERALEEVAQGMKLLPHQLDDSKTRRPQLYWELVILQAEVLGRQGKYSESLATYQSVLQAYEQDVTAGDVVLCARLYYTCGRLSVYLQQYEQAIDYYTRELQLTRAILKDSLAVARIYHELARVAKMGIGDWERALDYLQQAFLIEVEVWKIAQGASSKEHQDDFADVTAQMQDTKKSMGKILFALGRIDEAISLS